MGIHQRISIERWLVSSPHGKVIRDIRAHLLKRWHE